MKKYIIFVIVKMEKYYLLKIDGDSTRPDVLSHVEYKDPILAVNDILYYDDDLTVNLIKQKDRFQSEMNRLSNFGFTFTYRNENGSFILISSRIIKPYIGNRHEWAFNIINYIMTTQREEILNSLGI